MNAIEWLVLLLGGGLWLVILFTVGQFVEKHHRSGQDHFPPKWDPNKEGR